MQKELFIGYDIRIKKWDTESLSHGANQCKIKELYSRFTQIWPSRFIRGGVLSKEIIGNNYREIVSGEELTPVPTEYSQQYRHLGLWDNLGSMLCRVKFHTEQDIIAGFSIVYPLDEIIACKEANIQNTEQGEFFLAMHVPDPECIIKKYPNEWILCGYDIGDQFGYNPFLYVGANIDILQDIVKNERYELWTNRNSFGLLDDFETAIEECRIINAYDWQDCPYFIWKVYAAVDSGVLSYAV